MTASLNHFDHFNRGRHNQHCDRSLHSETQRRRIKFQTALATFTASNPRFRILDFGFWILDWLRVHG